MSTKFTTMAVLAAAFAVFSVALLSAVVDASPPVEDILVSGEIGGTDAEITADTTIGICRYMTFENEKGFVNVLVCDKEADRYEMYRQNFEMYEMVYYPKAFKICVGQDCIDERRGFVSFMANEVEVEDPPVSEEELYEYKNPSGFPVEAEGEIISDFTWDACRKVVWENNGYEGGLQVCHKGDSRFEVYYQEVDPEFNTEVCVNGYCVDEMQGYNSFTIDYLN